MMGSYNRTEITPRYSQTRSPSPVATTCTMPTNLHTITSQSSSNQRSERSLLERVLEPERKRRSDDYPDPPKRVRTDTYIPPYSRAASSSSRSSSRTRHEADSHSRIGNVYEGSEGESIADRRKSWRYDQRAPSDVTRSPRWTSRSNSVEINKKRSHPDSESEEGEYLSPTQTPPTIDKSRYESRHHHSHTRRPPRRKRHSSPMIVPMNVMPSNVPAVPAGEVEEGELPHVQPSKLAMAMENITYSSGNRSMGSGPASRSRSSSREGADRVKIKGEKGLGWHKSCEGNPRRSTPRQEHVKDHKGSSRRNTLHVSPYDSDGRRRESSRRGGRGNKMRSAESTTDTGYDSHSSTNSKSEPRTGPAAIRTNMHQKSPANTSTRRSPTSPMSQLESSLYAWFMQNYPIHSITTASLQRHASKMAIDMGGLTNRLGGDFKASQPWVMGFLNRFGIGNEGRRLVPVDTKRPGSSDQKQHSVELKTEGSNHVHGQTFAGLPETATVRDLASMLYTPRTPTGMSTPSTGDSAKGLKSPLEQLLFKMGDQKKDTSAGEASSSTTDPKLAVNTVTSAKSKKGAGRSTSPSTTASSPPSTKSRSSMLDSLEKTLHAWCNSNPTLISYHTIQKQALSLVSTQFPSLTNRIGGNFRASPCWALSFMNRYGIKESETVKHSKKKKKGSTERVRLEKFEKAVYEWIGLNSGERMSNQKLQRQATKMADEWGTYQDGELKNRHGAKFKASQCWVEGFMNRFGIRKGKDGSLNLQDEVKPSPRNSPRSSPKVMQRNRTPNGTPSPHSSPKMVASRAEMNTPKHASWKRRTVDRHAPREQSPMERLRSALPPLAPGSTVSLSQREGTPEKGELAKLLLLRASSSTEEMEVLQLPPQASLSNSDEDVGGSSPPSPVECLERKRGGHGTPKRARGTPTPKAVMEAVTNFAQKTAAEATRLANVNVESRMEQQQSHGVRKRASKRRTQASQQTALAYVAEPDRHAPVPADNDSSSTRQSSLQLDASSDPESEIFLADIERSHIGQEDEVVMRLEKSEDALYLEQDMQLDESDSDDLTMDLSSQAPWDRRPMTVLNHLSTPGASPAYAHAKSMTDVDLIVGTPPLSVEELTNDGPTVGPTPPTTKPKLAVMETIQMFEERSPVSTIPFELVAR